MRKILVYPGWFESLRTYRTNDLVFRSGAIEESDFGADHIIGMSLGALIVLKNATRVSGRIVLINPPVPRRGLLVWAVQWMKFMRHEGLMCNRQKFTANPMKFLRFASEALKLLTTDFSDVLESLPPSKALVIRGRHDSFFCDDQAVNFLKSKNIEILEVDSGHNWSEQIEEALSRL